MDEILTKYFDLTDITTIISPFFGGGSFEFYLQNKYNFEIIANDKFEPLYNFWINCKKNNKKLCEDLDKIEEVTKEDFQNYRNTIIKNDNSFDQALQYFIINRCSFSGATLSGGFSLEASKKRFTKSSINKIRKLNLTKFKIFNKDFENFMNKNKNIENSILFVDPPYYLETKSKLYGNNGDLHENFDHNKLYDLLKKQKNWLLTYNNCDYVKELYKNFEIIEVNWNYGMNKSKKSSEIVIINI